MLKPLVKKSEMKENYSSLVSKCPSNFLLSSNRGTSGTEAKVFPSLIKKNSSSFKKTKTKHEFLPEVTNTFYK